MKGWSDSIIGSSAKKIHYYIEGVSLCGRRRIDTGHKYFDITPKTKNDVYSGYCKMCIKISNENKKD